VRKSLSIFGAALALAIAVGTQPGHAADALTFVSYGGSFQDAQEKAFVKPFAEANNVQLTTDSGPTVAKIKAMVEAKNVQWDVVEVTEADYLNLVRLGLLEKIDYSQFDAATIKAIEPQFRPDYGVAAVMYSYGIGYRTDLGRSDHPISYAELWDTKKFPGPRALPTGTFANPPWEAALLADGVAPDKLYPIDFERATKSLDRIKPNVTVWFDNTAPGVQALVSGDVDYGLMPNGRVLQSKSEGAPVDFEYGQALLYVDYFVVPKGAPHKEAAMKLLAYASQAKPSAEFMKQIQYSMPNTDALQYLDPEYAKSLPSAPENLHRQIPTTGEFYGEDSGNGQTWQQISIDVWNKWYGQ
jgi:putative spermidine/putrescine transport system substrate-binding protein